MYHRIPLLPSLMGLALVPLALSCGTDVVDGPDGAFVPDTSSCDGVECPAGESCFGGACVPTDGCLDSDGDGFGEGCEAGDDCDDSDPLVSPARAEVCDGADNDCDFYLDEDGVCAPCVPFCEPGQRLCSGPAVVYCDDAIACPAFGDPVPCPFGETCRDGECIVECLDRDGDGRGVDCGRVNDCDDTRDDVYPGRAETCDGIDNNCNDQIDEGGICDLGCDESECAPGERVCSADGGGWLSCQTGPDGCRRWSGTIRCGGDRSCVDGECVDVVVCVDLDGDGGGPGCAAEDCRPADPTSGASAREVCDGVDNDCDGVADDGAVCESCTPATVARPATVRGGEALYRVSCGAADHIAIEARGRLPIVVQGGPDLVVERGTGTGAFVPAARAERLGNAWAFAPFDVGGSMIRVTGAQGSSYAVAVGVSGACGTDALEPNNTPTSGIAVGLGTFVAGGALCAGDFDFFEVDARPGTLLEAALVADPGPGQLVLSVWRNGEEIAPSFGLADAGGLTFGRRAHFRIEEPGRYAIGIRGLSRSTENAWAAAITTRTAPTCRDDAADSGSAEHDDSPSTARANAPSWTGTLCPGDFDVVSLGRLRAGANAMGSFDAPAGLRVTLLQNGWGAVRDFPSGIGFDGDYFLAVYGDTADATGTWRLNASVR